MKVQTAKQMIQIESWAAQINEWKQSGKTIRQWCLENGIDRKTFYYRRTRVREEMLEAVERQNITQGADLIGPDYSNGMEEMGNTTAVSLSVKGPKKPVFAVLPIPQATGSAMTVRMGGFSVDIQNGADDLLVEHVLRTMARL